MKWTVIYILIVIATSVMGYNLGYNLGYEDSRVDMTQELRKAVEEVEASKCLKQP